MSWLDLALVAVVATLTALGAERRLAGFLVGIGGALLLRPLLLLGHANAFLALVAALVAGLGLSLLGRRLFRQQRGGQPLLRALGGIGGLVLGLALVISLVTSLPIQRNDATNELYYPPRDLPAPLEGAVRRSQMVLLGRDILLYPLLVRQGDAPSNGDRVMRGLHRLFVVGEPWNDTF